MSPEPAQPTSALRPAQPTALPSEGREPPSTPSQAAPAPKTAPRTPEQAWAVLVRDAGKPLLSANAAFRSYQDGVLTLSARSDFWARSVETTLGEVPINRWFPSFRTLLVRVDSGGQTGREKRAIQDSERRIAALQAARTSEAVKILVSQLNGHLDEEGVEPPPLVIQDELEGLDIDSPTGGFDAMGFESG